MVTIGNAFFTNYGSMHRTKEQAESAEIIEREAAFQDTVIKIAVIPEDSYSYCGVRDAASVVYNNADAFIKALEEFGFFENRVTIKEA